MAKDENGDGLIARKLGGLRRKLSGRIYRGTSALYRATHRNAKPRSAKRRKLGEGVFVYLALLIPVLQFIIFYVAVNINSILLAFKEYDVLAGKYHFIGFDNFAAFFRDMIREPVLARAAKNSVILYLFGLLVSMPLGITISFFVYKKIPMAGFFKVVLFLPSIISSIVMVLMFKYFMEMVIPNLLSAMGVKEPPNFFYNSKYAFGTLIFYGLWTGFGGGIILYTGAMSRIPDSLVEYGQLEGMSMLKEFIHVTLPMIFPTITVFLVTGVAGLFTNNAGAYAFYAENAAYNVYTFGYYLFIQVIGSKASLAEYPYASAAGLCFTLVAAPVTLLVKYLLEKFGPNPEY